MFGRTTAVDQVMSHGNQTGTASLNPVVVKVNESTKKVPLEIKGDLVKDFICSKYRNKASFRKCCMLF